jgi:membrane fusion protein (multidrug efflux system)
MRYLSKLAYGLVLAILSLALVGAAGYRVFNAARGQDSPRPAPARERAFQVTVAPIKTTAVSPVISAYGEVKAWRTLEIRASSPGPIAVISPKFRDGAKVRAGELLFQIDPRDASSGVADAQVAVAQAKAELGQAQDLLALTGLELGTAQRQLELRSGEHTRKQRLAKDGYVSSTEIDDSASAVVSAEQGLAVQRQSMLTAERRIEAASLALRRAEIALTNAQKTLSDTSYRAPFDGPLTDVVATLGRRVGLNERLGVLIDLGALEVAFRVRDDEFSRILVPGGKGELRPLSLKIRLPLGKSFVDVPGKLTRASAVSNIDEGGYTLYAQVGADAGWALRPGDFVEVLLSEPELNAVVLPTHAVTEDGRIFVLGANDRLEQIQGVVMRRSADNVIMNGLPEGRQYVTARQPYLSAGVRVKPISTTLTAAPEPGGVSAAGDIKDSPPRAVTVMVELSAQRRQRLLAFIESSERLPPKMKAGILGRLAQPTVPQRMVDRIERRMNGG